MISDYAKYPNAFVDSKDNQITFDAPDVKDFIKPETELFFRMEYTKLLVKLHLHVTVNMILLNSMIDFVWSMITIISLLYL